MTVLVMCGHAYIVLVMKRRDKYKLNRNRVAVCEQMDAYYY